MRNALGGNSKGVSKTGHGGKPYQKTGWFETMQTYLNDSPNTSKPAIFDLWDSQLATEYCRLQESLVGYRWLKDRVGINRCRRRLFLIQAERERREYEEAYEEALWDITE